MQVRTAGVGEDAGVGGFSRAGAVGWWWWEAQEEGCRATPELQELGMVQGLAHSCPGLSRPPHHNFLVFQKYCSGQKSGNSLSGQVGDGGFFVLFFVFFSLSLDLHWGAWVQPLA